MAVKLAGSRAWAVAAAAVLGALLAACAPSYHYLASTSSGTYLKIPYSWKVFGQKTLRQQGFITGRVPFLEVFDDSSHPTPHHLFEGTSKPWGLTGVLSVSPSSQLNYSFDSLLNTLVPLDQLQNDPSVTVTPISGPQVITRGSLRGIEATFEIRPMGQGAFDFEQAALVNPATTQTWVLAVGCSPSCFAQHRSTINSIVNTWFVKPR